VSAYNPPERPESVLKLLTDIPPFGFTKDGQRVDLTSDLWPMKVKADLSSTQNVNWTALRLIKVVDGRKPVMSDRSVHYLKIYVAHRMGGLYPDSISSILVAAHGFAHWLGVNPEYLPADRSFDWSDLTADLFAEWVRAEHLTKRKGDYARSIRKFYQWCADSDGELHGFSDDVAKSISLIRLKSRIPGEAVARRDKRRGPFDREELELIHAACEAGKGNDRDRALTWVFLCTGRRPQQIALLRRRDLQIFNEEASVALPASQVGGSRAYQLRITKIKKHNTEPEYYLLPLSKGCGNLLTQVIPLEDDLDAPLFWWLGADYESEVLRSLIRFFEVADLRSHRLPIENPPPEGPFYERLNVFPRRFRSGLATDRLAQGDTLENLSNFLGHSSTQHVKVYAQTTALIADEVCRATDHAVAPLVRRFRGRIEDPAEPLSAPSIPAVITPLTGRRSLKVLGSIGKCEAGGECPFNPVTSCFGCESFVARPDAPLRELREMLQEELKEFGDLASPTLSGELAPVLKEIDNWIDHIDRARRRAEGGGHNEH
jgi:integrase